MGDNFLHLCAFQVGIMPKISTTSLKKKQHKVNSEALTSFHIPVHSHIYPLASKIVLVQKIQRKQFLSGYTHLVSVQECWGSYASWGIRCLLCFIFRTLLGYMMQRHVQMYLPVRWHKEADVTNHKSILAC